MPIINCYTEGSSNKPWLLTSTFEGVDDVGERTENVLSVAGPECVRCQVVMRVHN